MKSISNILGFNKEAMLLDSKLYIVKSMVAIATGYIIGSKMPIANLDMISVLLGVMYNLEPVNVSGIKGGINQLLASTLGAACTGILILLFGINVYTIALGMALTLYVSLKINWRMVSPVAIFTCIYMTQFVQLNAAAEPSIWLTFRLRIAALSLGVAIAIFYNYLFSFFYYKKIGHKRLEFVKLQTLKGLTHIKNQLLCTDISNENSNILYQSIFNDVELVNSNIKTMLSESALPYKAVQKDELVTISTIIDDLKKINHLSYDIYFAYKEDPFLDIHSEKILSSIDNVIVSLSTIDFNNLNLENKNFQNNHIDYSGSESNRLIWNLKTIEKSVENIYSSAKILSLKNIIMP